MEIAAIITAVATVLGAIGTGAWKLIDRADKKREHREIKVEEILKKRIADLEAEKKHDTEVRRAERDEWLKEKNQLKRYCSKIKSSAGMWREQLILNNIQPEPANWPEEEDAR